MITDNDSVSDGSDGTALRGRGDESKSSGETYSNTSRTNNVDSALQQLGVQQENKIVRSSKVCVYVFLLLVAIGGSLLTWLFLKEEEQLSLAQQFDVLAKEILAVSTLNALSIFALYEAEALQMTTHAMTSGQQWPFFSLAMFEVEADLLYNQTRTGDYIALHPIVKANQKLEWEQYANSNQGWIQDAYDFYGVSGTPPPICPVISSSTTCTPTDNRTDGIYLPTWQIAPAPGDHERFVNFDGLSSESFSTSFYRMMDRGDVIVADAISLESEDGFPLSLLMTPIHQGIRPQSPIVAVLVGVIPWNDFFENMLPEGEDGIIVVVRNERQAFTFEIDGPRVDYLGPGDLHDPYYDSFVNVNEFAGFAEGSSDLGFILSVYPSQEFEEEHLDNSTLVYTLAVAFVFLFAMSVFFVYDFFVEQRQTKVMITATKSSAIVNSLFPANVRDRLMEEQAVSTGDKKHSPFHAGGLEEIPSSKPIADLFPEATVMFADLAGFTAWSSIREPSQVFFLLESLYNSFDKIARKMKVFKVETIGDSYVAVAGLPDPRKDHAEVMARFAHKCLVKTNTLVHTLETTLGPGTSELKMRIGLHSGPVTAGVLRGEKSRFQLFGDTVNTAARMESTGVKNRIHLSKETADLIIAGGKEHWVKPRSTKVFAKGKGELQTFWYAQGTDSDTTDSTDDINTSARNEGIGERDASLTLQQSPNRASIDRLVLWNVENLCLPLKKLIASRKGQKQLSLQEWRRLKIQSIHANSIVLDEVEEVISLQENGVVDFGSMIDSVVLDKLVVDQLTNYVATISSMYRPHAFHNFDHASHVAQSVTKLLSRVVTPDQINYESMSYTPKAAPDKLHDFTFGITSNPLIHFAVILSALIHDVDHPGVPNATLVKEGADMAITYKNKSVAEQNSVDLAWGLLMEPQYEDLRRCIYTTQGELESFRKLLVNAVLATDVIDKELGNLRKRRWDLAFQTNESNSPCDNSCNMTNRKATIVIEYLIQASDVAHTMQHWQIYTHWNEKFFQECYQAYKDGRSEIDPKEGWYEGELGFFDFYVIPLAKRLKECGVFGVSSDEYLNYAVSNRDEWSRRGKEMVELYSEALGVKAN